MCATQFIVTGLHKHQQEIRGFTDETCTVNCGESERIQRKSNETSQTTKLPDGAQETNGTLKFWWTRLNQVQHIVWTVHTYCTLSASRREKNRVVVEGRCDLPLECRNLRPQQWLTCSFTDGVMGINSEINKEVKYYACEVTQASKALMPSPRWRPECYLMRL